MVDKDADDNRVLRLQYENVVLSYNKNVAHILDFLGESVTVHSNKKQYFDPENSKKNIGLWKLIPDQHIIRQIEEKLPEYCFNI